MRHCLTNINTEVRTATCSVCGPCKITTRVKKQGTWRCIATTRTSAKLAKNTLKAYKKWCKKRGLNPDEVIQFREKTKDRDCEICGCSNIKQQMVVDHDHETGVLRGRLCTNCNAGIGFLKDDITVLQAAVKYLQSHKLRKVS